MSETEIVDGEIVEPVETPNPAALATTEHEPSSDLVELSASIPDIVGAFDKHQKVMSEILEDSDFQQIGKRKFPKKSAWRKLAVAYGVTCKITDRSYDREDQRIIRAEVLVVATAPNGRQMDGLGACDIYEKCCQVKRCRIKYEDHEHCDEINCDGTRHFAHPQHDIPATAATRATNRACSDLFGMGEVSAEEIIDGGAYNETTDQPQDDERTVTNNQPTVQTPPLDAPACPNCRAPMIVGPYRTKGNGPEWKCSKSNWNRQTKTEDGCGGVRWPKKNDEYSEGY